MTSMGRGFERDLVAAMSDDVGQPPERLLAQILGETQRMRPLPAAVALLTAPPMALPTRVVVGVRRSRILLVAAALLSIGAALLAGAILRTPIAPPDAWMGWGGDASRAAVAVSGPTGVPRIRWTFRADGAIEATPLIIGDLVIVSSIDGTLHALDLRTGGERWTAAIGANVGPPATDGNLVFVEDGGGSVHALHLGDGSFAWTSVVLGMPSVDPAIAGGTLYLATRDGGVAALDATDGSPRWQTTLGTSAAPIAGIAVAGEFVLVTTNDYRLVAIRRGDGEQSWAVPIDAEVPGMPVAAGGIVWAGVGYDVRGGTLRAFRLADGAAVWETDEPLMAPAVAGDLAISSNAESLTSARDAATGVERWRSPSGSTLRQVAIAGDTAFVLSETERQVYGLDTATGARRWQLALDSRPGCCMALAEGVLAVGTANGTLTVFESGPPVVELPSPSSGFVPASGSPSAAFESPAAGLATVPLEITRRFTPAELGIERPLGAAMSDAGDIYVSDTSQHVTHIAPDGTVDRWGGPGSAEGEFAFGTFEGGTNARGAIAVGPDGLVYVSDADNHRVQVFTADGDFVRAIGELGSEPGQFTIPYDLGVDGDGNVYVTDDGAERITKLAPDGSPLWIADATTDARLQGHAHTAAFDSAGRLVVTIDDTQTILRLDPSTGQVLEALPGGGCESQPDPWDRIWVLDCTATELQVVDAAGNPLIVDRKLGLTVLRLRDDAQGVALGGDGSVLAVEVMPP
jgi:outer membrane protein assembly factor BamB